MDPNALMKYTSILDPELQEFEWLEEVRTEPKHQNPTLFQAPNLIMPTIQKAKENLIKSNLGIAPKEADRTQSCALACVDGLRAESFIPCQ